MNSGEKTIKLYPGATPGSENLDIAEELFTEERNGFRKDLVQNVTSPELLMYLPGNAKDVPAMIIIPGGAFRRQVLSHEGRDVAKWLNAQGMAAFVLKTRLPVNDHANKYDVLLMDIQRAVRIVRAHADEWGICRDAIGVMGFSAGGYQTALIATGFDMQMNPPMDEIDTFSARPDFCVLGYPAISYEAQERRALEYNHPYEEYQKEQLLKYKPHEMLDENTPPLFIFETDDDLVTPADNSVLLYMAAREKKVPAELHIFRTGKHGFGLGDEEGQTGQWKDLFLKWIKTLGIKKESLNGLL